MDKILLFRLTVLVAIFLSIKDKTGEVNKKNANDFINDEKKSRSVLDIIRQNEFFRVVKDKDQKYKDYQKEFLSFLTGNEFSEEQFIKKLHFDLQNASDEEVHLLIDIALEIISADHEITPKEIEALELVANDLDPRIKEVLQQKLNTKKEKITSSRKKSKIKVFAFIFATALIAATAFIFYIYLNKVPEMKIKAFSPSDKNHGLQRLKPFIVNLEIEAKNFDKYIDGFCRELALAQQNIALTQCTLIRYENNILQLELHFGGIDTKSQLLTVALKNPNLYNMTGQEAHSIKADFVAPPLKLLSIEASKKNLLPLKKDEPFLVDLVFSGQDLVSEQIKDLCSQISSGSDDFTIHSCRELDYKDNLLKIELGAKSKKSGKQNFNIGLKDKDSFHIADIESNYFSSKFLVPIHLTSIAIPEKENNFPLIQSEPFTADLSFKASGLHPEEKEEFCKTLIPLPQDVFMLYQIKNSNYSSDVLSVSVALVSKKYGEQTLIFGQNKNSRFDFVNDSVGYKENFRIPIKITSLRIDAGKESKIGEPFFLNANFDADNLTEPQQKTLCEQLRLPKQQFEVIDCKPLNYEKNNLAVQFKAKALTPGIQQIDIALDAGSEYKIINQKEHTLSNKFYQDIKLTRIELSNKNTLPLRQNVDFTADCFFTTAQSISSEDTELFATHLKMPDDFQLKNWKVINYKAETFQLEVVVNAKTQGEFPLRFDLKEGTNYCLVTENNASPPLSVRTMPIKLKSIEVSRENNEFPLRRLMPFRADLKFERSSLKEKQPNSFCKLIASATVDFKIIKKTVNSYDNESIFSIQVDVEAQHAGKIDFKIKLESNDDFLLLDNENNFFSCTFKERLSDCSNFIESREGHSDEFKSGIDFAKCVNSWKITEELQNGVELTDIERGIPQSNFKKFLLLLESTDKPKNLFNWYLGVLSVKPPKEYLPYLRFFQEGCLNYLKGLFNNKENLLISTNILSENYPKGAYPLEDMSLISDTKSQKITGYSYTEMKINRFKKPKPCNENAFFYEYKKNKFSMYSGDCDMTFFHNQSWHNFENEEIMQKSFCTMNDSFLYKSELLNISPVSNKYKVTIRGGFDKRFCVVIEGHYPGYSFAPRVILLDKNCKKQNMGYNFKGIFEQNYGGDKDNYENAANFINTEFLSKSYPERTGDTAKLDGKVHLLGLTTDKGNIHWLYLDKVDMQNGSVEIKLKESNLSSLFPSGYLIYAYDETNKIFGVLKNYSHPEFSGGYIKQTLFFNHWTNNYFRTKEAPC